MSQAVPTTQGPKRWHNHLPPWIEQRMQLSQLNPIYRKTLQAVADGCDPPPRDGTLIGARGTQHLARLAGVSSRTFWRHIKHLEAAGYLVIIARLKSDDHLDGANIYAIPGAPGALDRHKRGRRVQIMRPDQVGRWIAQEFREGDQGQLWATTRHDQSTTPQEGGPAHGRSTAPTPDRMSRTPMSKCHTSIYGDLRW